MTNQNTANENPKSLVLGIDTGGTYTDGVLLEYESRRVLVSHKSLTTKRDLSIGIEEVITGIRIDDPSAIRMVSISTTLATNAIAEGKGKGVALLLIGYDPELIATFKMERQFATPHYYYFAGGHDLYGQEKEPLDLPAILAKVNQIKNQVDALAISSYFSPLNPEHEYRTFEAVAEICDLPVVLGHQLSTKLGSVERATTAALNASLLAVLQDFIVAVQQAMARRQIKAPLMVVRGDGTLMHHEFAGRTPVETIHSGPAASAIGGRFLSGLEHALVVDVGGTTTDIALIEAGQVAVIEDGATVGNYKTSVKAAHLHSIALGGDSHITTTPAARELIIGPERVMPLAHLAWQFPQIQLQLRAKSLQSPLQLTPESLEYWYLLREPSTAKTKQETALINLLRHRPRSVPEILEHLNLYHVSQLNVGDLLRREIIGKAGLTPTDLLHVEGHYTPWNRDAAHLALQVFGLLYAQNSADICRSVWQQITDTIAGAIIAFLTGISPSPTELPQNDLGRWFFYNSLHPRHPHLETEFRLRHPIIGIGAPAHILLKDVAAGLHTDLILPRHHQVANAVGAVAGSVMATEEVLVYPRLTAEGLDVIGYYVQNSSARQEFEHLTDALSYARTLCREGALHAAHQAGAFDPQVVIDELADGLDTYRIRARAVGNPRLAGSN